MSYLPGYMLHGHTMLPHAGLTTVVRRASYFIGGCGSAVYSPLGKGSTGGKSKATWIDTLHLYW